jgi:hypothetical protein
MLFFYRAITLLGISIFAFGCGSSEQFTPVGSQSDSNLSSSSPPVLTSVSPSSGPEAGGTLLTLRGSNFSLGASITAAGLPCRLMTQDSKTLTCLTSAYSSDGVLGSSTSVEVKNGNGKKSILSSSFQYNPAPRIESTYPVSGPVTGGTRITIYGSDFNSKTRITIGGNPCPQVAGSSGRFSVSCIIPEGNSSGAADVQVVNSDGQSYSLKNGYTYERVIPRITGLYPQTGLISGGTRISIDGAYFRPSATVTVGSSTCTQVQVSTDGTSLSCITPVSARADEFRISVRNPDGETSVDSFTFRYHHPPIQLTRINPNYGTRLGGTRITIDGTGFENGAQVRVGNLNCPIVSQSAVRIVCTTPFSRSAGHSPITVRNMNGVISDQLRFFYELPVMELTRIHPNKGPKHGGTEITLTGTGFPQNIAISVKLGTDTLCTNVRWVSTTEIRCTTGAYYEDGSVPVRIEAEEFEGESLENAFTYDSLSVNRINPNQGFARGGTRIMIRGKNFKPGATVSIGGSACNNVQISAHGTRIHCITPLSATAEIKNLVVQNQDGEVSDPIPFQYIFPPITLTRVEPNRGNMSGGTQLTLTGTNFRPGTRIYVGTDLCINPTWVSETRMTCITPSTRAIFHPLPVTIRAANAAVLSTLENAFFFFGIVPTITSASPTQGRSGDILTIRGSNFNPEDARVILGHIGCRILEITATTIRCRIIDAEYTGRVDVRVINGATLETIGGRFEFLPPLPAQMTSISPNVGTKQGDTLILIRGTRFREGVQVKVGNTPCLHISQTSTAIACITPPSRNAGPTPIEVKNPRSQPFRLENAYTYQNTADAISVLELSGHNQYGGANPADPSEINLIGNTIRMRREQGPTYYGLYHLESVAGGLEVELPIRAFSLQAPDTVEQLKRNYLVAPEVAAIPYDSLLTYFDQVFPGGRMLPANHPLFFDWVSLVDFSSSHGDEMPAQIGQSEGGAIAQARQGFQRLIDFANTQAGNTGWILDLRYQTKRVLVELQANPTPDKIKNAVLVLSSVGQHCGPGNGEGAILVARMFFNGRLLHVNMNEPVTFEDHILIRLDQLRDEIFNLTVAFVNDTQTAHTKNYYRQALHDELKIAPGFANDPYAGAANRVLTLDEFLQNFFTGKMGFEGDTEEDGRSHRGYTPLEIAKALIDFLRLNTANPHYAPEIKAYFASRVTLAEAQDWMRDLNDASLRAQGEVLAADCNDLSTPEKRQACVTEILEGYQGQENILKEMFVNSTYFEQRGPYFYLTDTGLRELMIQLEILKLPIDEQPGPIAVN